MKYGPGPVGSEYEGVDETVVDAWTELAITRTAPADTEFVGVTLQAWGNGSLFYFDDVGLIPEPGVVGLIAITGAILVIRRRLARSRA